MASLAQITANTANAQHSTGPTTAQGKVRSAVNATKYGFYAKQAVLLTEVDRLDFDALVQSYKLQLHPHGPIEETLFNQIILAVWNLQRVNEIEAALALTDGLDPLLSTSKTIDRIIAFRLSTERSFLKLLAEYNKLKVTNPTETVVSQNEPIYYSQPPQLEVRVGSKIGRNEPCPCKSGRKYKQCCLKIEPNLLAQLMTSTSNLCGTPA